MKLLRLILLLAVLWLGAPLAALQAHELQPVYLELRQTGPETWHVLWKVPARADLQDAIRPRLPENCRAVSEPVRVKTTDGIVEQFSVSAPGGIDNRPVAVEGPAAA